MAGEDGGQNIAWKIGSIMGEDTSSTSLVVVAETRESAASIASIGEYSLRCREKVCGLSEISTAKRHWTC